MKRILLDHTEDYETPWSILSRYDLWLRVYCVLKNHKISIFFLAKRGKLVLDVYRIFWKFEIKSKNYTHHLNISHGFNVFFFSWYLFKTSHTLFMAYMNQNEKHSTQKYNFHSVQGTFSFSFFPFFCIFFCVFLIFFFFFFLVIFSFLTTWMVGFVLLTRLRTQKLSHEKRKIYMKIL